MGVTELGKLIPKEVRREVELANLNGKTIALDSYNALYQFLASIRQPDGTPLMDSKGRITSHLSGLLYRTLNLMEHGIKPVYVFDGKTPEMKTLEVLRRRQQKEKAMRELEKALAEGRVEDVRKYAQRAVFLSNDMVEDAKRLLTYMGVPWVQAPAEGEAQAAHMVKRGSAWASASQDYDALLFGSPRLVRNLAITGRRKLPGRDEYIEVKPELIELEDVLKALRLKSREQLVDLAILLGTDYNPDGVPGVGPQRAIKLVWEFGSIDRLLDKVLKSAHFPVDPLKIRDYFMNPEVTDDYEIKFEPPDEKKLVEFLVDEHDFSAERVKSAVDRLKKAYAKVKSTSTLDVFW